jgi:hypothetical protein
VKDAEWIAQLVRHGLVAKSFVPPPAIRDGSMQNPGGYHAAADRA